MKTIGITGGVGAGKTQIIDYLSSNYNCKVIVADRLAYELESPGHECYDRIVSLLGSDIIDEDGFIVKTKMAEKIFSDNTLLEKVNGIIHPAVKSFILDDIENERKKGVVDFYLLEAALLIEEGYDKILDELWYIRVDSDIRRERLKASRGYSDKKIDAILKSQLSDDVFISKCKKVIDNSKDLEHTYRQLDAAINGD